MAVGSVYKVTILAHNDQAPVVLVFHYETFISLGDQSLEVASLLAAVDEVLFKKTIINDLLDFCHSSVVFDQIQVRDVLNPTVGGDLILTSPNVGSLAGSQLPQQVAMLGRKGTGLIGSSFRGRNFLPTGNAGSLAVDGNWGAIFLSNALDFYSNLDTIVDPLAPLNFVFLLTIWSETKGLSTLVTDFSILLDTRTQRRRAY